MLLTGNGNPLLAVGDGAIGVEGGLGGSVLKDAPPAWLVSLDGQGAQRLTQIAVQPNESIWQSGTREDALSAFNRFVELYSAKYPKVAEKLTMDRDEPLVS